MTTTISLLLVLMMASAGQASGAAPVSQSTAGGSDGDVDLAVAQLAEERDIPVAEAEARLAWQERLPLLEAMARDLLGERFAGVWVDPADGDRLKVGVVDGAGRRGGTDLARRAVDAAGLDGAADVVGVHSSYQDLERASDWLGLELERVNADAPWPLSSSFRPSTNRVYLDVPERGELTREQQRVVDVAQRRYADLLEVRTYRERTVALRCSYPWCDKPLRGGIRIGNAEAAPCTAAFLARSRSDNRLYQFTAGHCVEATDATWYTYWPDGSRHDIGPRHNSEWSGAGDMAILRVNNPAGWSARAWVNVTAGPYTTANSEYRIRSDSTSSEGQWVCTTGSFFGRSDCGYVLDLGVTRTYNGVTVRNLAQSNICGVPGDSGAPIYIRNTALGLTVAGDRGTVCEPNFAVLYQGIQGAENAMNVNVAHEQP